MKDTTKLGRPSIISYEQFMPVWLQLTEEGRASINAVQESLGGSKSTITALRERYEREKMAEKVALLNDIKLPDAIRFAIAEIKVKQITTIEKGQADLELRLNEVIQSLKEAELKYASIKSLLEKEKSAFEAKEKILHGQRMAAEALRTQAEDREQKAIKRCEELAEQLGQAKQATAVAQKEIALLRERKK